MFWLGLLIGTVIGFSIGVLVIAMIVACGEDEHYNKNTKKDFVIEETEEVWIDNGRVIS
jgi:hypothetical protein